MSFLVGKKVALREVRKSDLKQFQKFRNSYEDTKNFRTWYPLTKYNQGKYWTEIVNNHDKHIVFTIIKRNSIIYPLYHTIGEVRCSYIDWVNRKGEIGIVIGKEFRRKGYATEALELLMEFVFNRMNLNRLEAQYIEDNDASRKLFHGLGFIEEGIIRDAQYYDGMYHDTIISSMLAIEYISKKSSH